jgi:sulfate adenylyltransferase
MSDNYPIAPHGGVLVNRLCVMGAEFERLRERALAAPVVILSDVSLSDLELIATGVYSPLTGFMTRADYLSVVQNMRLTSAVPWTIPITLPVRGDKAQTLIVGKDVALVSESGSLVGLMELAEKFTYNKPLEAEEVYRTTDGAHPGVTRLYEQGDIYLAGSVWMLTEPKPAFPDLYRTPQQMRAAFAERNWERIVAFQTRNPIHRAHEYLQKCALEMADGLLLHPLVGETKSDDIPASVRVESYQVIVEKYYPANRVLLSAFPAAMRYAGPREAVFHALCRKNYGCTHFIVGRDHAGVGQYYGTYDAQRIFKQFDAAEIGITPLLFENAFHCRECGQIVTAKTCPHSSESWLNLSGTQVRAMLAKGQMLPSEFTRPEVSQVLLRGLAAKA